MVTPKVLVTASLLALLSGCAAGPQYQVEKRNEDLTPRQVAEDSAKFLGGNIVWGGVILEAENLESSTRFVVLAYPLDRYQAPRLSQEAIGRFVVEVEGYLETTDYAADRRLTITGKVQQVESVKVGEAVYRYPVVRADAYHLWPVNGANLSQPSVRFGIGINISN